MDSLPDIDYLRGYPGKSRTGPENTNSSVNTVIINDTIIQKYIKDVLGKDIPFEDLGEEERNKILLAINNDSFKKVFSQKYILSNDKN